MSLLRCVDDQSAVPAPGSSPTAARTASARRPECEDREGGETETLITKEERQKPPNAFVERKRLIAKEERQDGNLNREGEMLEEREGQAWQTMLREAHETKHNSQTLVGAHHC